MRFLDRFRGGPPTPDQFAKIMADALRSAGDDRTSTYDKAEFRLRYVRDGRQAGASSLRNLYTEYCNAARKDRKAWLARTCSALLNQMELPEEFEDVKPDLMPTVRTRSVLEMFRNEAERLGATSTVLPSIPLTDHLVICLVYDLPNSMRFVTQDDLNTWGVTPYEAVEVARHNLQERPFTIANFGERLIVIESGDAYDGTRVLLTDQINGLKLDGQPIAMPINRNSLLITGSEDVVGLTLMIALAEQKLGEARAICPIPMLLAGDEWQTWLTPYDHPLVDAFKQLELKYLHGEYAEQKTLLDKRNEQLGNDVFVATFSAIKRSEKLMSYCVWSKAVPSWLPKADFVGLFDQEANSHKFVPWGRLQAIAGDMMQPLDYYPPRWSVTDFSTDEQIARMEPEFWGA